MGEGGTHGGWVPEVLVVPEVAEGRQSSPVRPLWLPGLGERWAEPREVPVMVR